MQKAQKEIVLPSGGKCIVRKLSERDFIAAGQTLLFLNFAAPSKRKQPVAEISEEKAFESLVSLTEVMLTNCCGPIDFPDGTRLKIVKKPFYECDQTEIAIETLDQKDAAFIVDQVQALSGMTKEAAAAAQTFPEGQANGSSAAPAGEQLQGSPVRPAEPQSV
jgi:hypothetical protein